MDPNDTMFILILCGFAAVGVVMLALNGYSFYQIKAEIGGAVLVIGGFAAALHFFKR